MESLLDLQTRVPGLSKLKYPGALCYQQHKEPGACIMQERKPEPKWSRETVLFKLSYQQQRHQK